jgi:probable F420-dependent oxidoreductase
MRISAAIGNWLDRPPEEALHTAVLADRLGYEELWIGEIDTWDAFSLATAVGLATDQIAMTVGPLAVSVRDPAMIAMGAASVAALTRRRVGVALGTSGATLVEEWHGRSRAGAAAELEGSARAVTTLLKGERAASDGDAGGTTGFRLRLAPPGGSLTVAALGDRAVDVAAAHADRVVINLATPERAAHLRSRLDAAASRAGRRSPALAAWLPAAVDPTPESYAQLIWSLVPYLSAPGYADMMADAGFTEAVSLARAGTTARDLLPALPLEMAGTVGLVGAAAAVRSRVAAYADAGVDEITIMPVTGGDPGGERTLTAFRKIAGSS